jgi:hypothetical protein
MRGARRAGGQVSVVLAALALTAGCSGGSDGDGAGTPIGCDMVPTGKVVGLLGGDVTTTARGTLDGLRSKHTKAVCRSVVPGHPERSVTIIAEYHPEPYQLPNRSCSAGWVYAGTPEKFTPACQETVAGHGRTELVVRWQPYLMHVVIGRSDRNWGGDPERALAMSRIVAQRLGVSAAAGDG